MKQSDQTRSNDRGEPFIEPLEINGMHGRVMRLPAKKGATREILVLYGHHGLLERWWGLMQNANDFGAVTMPDLPGFGGMDTFYKIGKPATIDNYADYIADFIKQEYGNRHISVMGISFGFLVITRMLQRHPELTDQVDLLISAAGFMKREDFMFTPARYNSYLYGARIMSIPPLYVLFRYTALNSWVLRTVYARINQNTRAKFADSEGDSEQFKKTMDMEIDLWHKNETRTYMRTTVELLTVDNTQTRINLPVWHVYSKKDHFFNGKSVEKHMRRVYTDFIPATMELNSHVVNVLATKEEAAALIPESLRKVLNAKA